MAILDDVIGVFSPGWKAARLRSRAVIQAYEAVKTTRTHKARRENRTADQLSQYGAVSLREQARYLDNNHDLVIGVFDKLEERVVGKNGIIVEPHPVLRNGAIARDLAAEIRTRWSEWSVSPEVTGQFTRPMLERLMLRTWLRDGEVFAQMVSGRINSLTPSAGVHFWLEALEPDFIPMTSDESNRLNQGVFVDDWGRPEKYLVYKSRPVSGRQMETKEVDAERMLHLKFVRRLHQMRGTSLLSGVLIRLSALKEYEDSELTAARVAAALGMYIRKGDGQSYETDGNYSKENERELTIQPGIIYDDLKPGEEIGMVKSDRPNPNLETFRNAQLRAVAAGSRLSFSSTARNYNGTYSAQRQELVESTDGYLILQDWFMGDQQRQRYQVQLSLRQKYQQQLEQLRRDSEQKGTYNTDDYRKAEQALTESLNRQLNENRRYWQQLEIAQGNWKNGVLRAFQDFTVDADNTAGTAEQVFSSAFSNMGNGLATFVTTGKLNFKSFTSSVLSDMAKILAQATMMKSIKGIGSVLGFDLSSLSLNANGGIYQSADLSRYSGTVVNRPTFFAFAKGAGVMGEAGPEAILPLRRGADGKLGVVADIGGSGMAMFAPQYNIEINNDGTNGQIGPAALKVVYDLGKKAAADFMQQQARDGGRLSGAYR
ncbi:phage portal protein [Escherichia coli]|uniref:phage portal protein n=1 Tax=Escherichia coli TaxID=562 RepID=UPI003F470CBD